MMTLRSGQGSRWTVRQAISIGRRLRSVEGCWGCKELFCTWKDQMERSKVLRQSRGTSRRQDYELGAHF